MCEASHLKWYKGIYNLSIQFTSMELCWILWLKNCLNAERCWIQSTVLYFGYGKGEGRGGGMEWCIEKTKLQTGVAST